MVAPGRTFAQPGAGSPDFTATGATTAIMLMSSQGFQYVGLNNVSVTLIRAAPATGGVPEPASWALMILGFGGVGASLRRRSVRQVRALA